MNIIGYGEDSLTFWALTQKLEKILEKLKDGSEPEKCILFYRPSFGRGGRGTSNFGEFDAILATNKAIYLVESKWENSHKEWKKRARQIRLDQSQVNRHRIFKWYFDKWNGNDKNNIFDEKNNDLKREFSEKFKKTKKDETVVDMTIPASSTSLAKRIKLIMEKLKTFEHNKEAVKNVVLFFHSTEKTCKLPEVVKLPKDNEEIEFEKVITIIYGRDEKYNSLGFVNMSNKSKLICRINQIIKEQCINKK
ncbi:MAG: hypothetical protein SCARUB_04936 [Candidatus Scalindua rubra]|uniref:Uncharacterized protein n=1 Tax=Candidatus Scalindua rubra TaxID=1872076 RepID=A0A1E3X328_9BACT|nr:MAG: hypothetical protein SCARUB_04936 [Candidatus Scalindua rubra]